jgi:predicted nuclease of predicted toxin-antitoxin system
MMRFLADENCDASIVRALRSLGHDVEYVAELSPGETDTNLLDKANRDQRILITEDRDFSNLIFRDKRNAFGVIYVRVAVAKRTLKSQLVADFVTNHKASLALKLVVITENKIRLRTLPTPANGSD